MLNLLNVDSTLLEGSIVGQRRKVDIGLSSLEMALSAADCQIVDRVRALPSKTVDHQYQRSGSARMERNVVHT